MDRARQARCAVNATLARDFREAVNAAWLAHIAENLAARTLACHEAFIVSGVGALAFVLMAYELKPRRKPHPDARALLNELEALGEAMLNKVDA